MRFMMMIKGNADYEAGLPPSPELMSGMIKLTGEMAKAGVLLASDGLQPSAKGSRIKLAAGKRTVIDGPFAEAKEVIGGYAIIEARSKYEAVAIAQRVIDVHVDAGIKDIEMEIRPLYESGQCGDAHTAPAEASCAS
jgi:hypothetical protein